MSCIKRLLWVSCCVYAVGHAADRVKDADCAKKLAIMAIKGHRAVDDQSTQAKPNNVRPTIRKPEDWKSGEFFINCSGATDPDWFLAEPEQQG